MPSKDGVGQIVAALATGCAPRALTCRLGVVAPLFGDLGALTAWTADAVWPAQGTDSRKAFRVVDEGLDVYHGASIAYHAMRDKSNVKEDTP